MACTILDGAEEYDSDRFLVAQVRLQQLVVKGYNAYPNMDFDTSAQADFSAAVFMTVKSIRNEMESLKKNLPPEIQNHCESPHYWTCSRLHSQIYSAGIFHDKIGMLMDTQIQIYSLSSVVAR